MVTMKRADITRDQVLAAARSNERTLDALVTATGAPEKVALAAIEREVDQGVLDYGVSLATAFPVEMEIER